jgi:hypothetical protein
MGEVIQLGSRSHVGGFETEILPHPKAHLTGAFLRWKRYRRWTTSLSIGTCELCDSPFTEGGEPGLNAGYSVSGGGPAGQDDYCWICAICFELWQDHFDWTVLDSRSRPTQPPGILQSIFMNEAVSPEPERDAKPMLLLLPSPLPQRV